MAKKRKKINAKINSNRSNPINNSNAIIRNSLLKRIISVLFKLVNPVWILISCLVLIGGLDFYWPKFTIKYNNSWNVNDPFKSTFEIKNEGNFLCYETKYIVEPNKFKINSDVTINGQLIFDKKNYVPRLCPNESTTISIENIVKAAPRSIDYFEIYFVLDYRPVFIKYLLNLPRFMLKPFIFKDTYRFSVRKVDSGYIWERLYLDKNTPNS